MDEYNSDKEQSQIFTREGDSLTGLSTAPACSPANMILTLWRHITDLGGHYGVNPALFAVLYFAHHPLFWGTMAWLAARVRRKKPTAAVVALGVFFWFLPYSYVFVFGRGLPWWVYALAAAAVAVGGTHAVKEIRRRLSAGPES